MPSLDIVSRLDWAELDNAINNTKKVLANRFDFRGATVEVEVDRKNKKLTLLSDDGTKVNAVRETFLAEAVKRKLDPKAFHFKDNEDAAAGKVRRHCDVKEGLEQQLAKDLVKKIRDSKLKVQASILGEEVRVTGKQIDDLQAVMSLMRADTTVGVPLQFVNMKRD